MAGVPSKLRKIIGKIDSLRRQSHATIVTIAYTTALVRKGKFNKFIKKIMMCSICERAFGSKLALRYHGEIIHDEIDLELGCKFCKNCLRPVIIWM